MSKSSLTFETLRGANIARLPQFKNSKGLPAHSAPDGSDWSLGEWMNAILGELGEAANIVKKVKRGDLTIAEARASLAKEFADVVTYLDITAMQCGVDLGQATADKFNEVSIRVGSTVRIEGDSWHHEDSPYSASDEEIDSIGWRAYENGKKLYDVRAFATTSLAFDELPEHARVYWISRAEKAAK